MSANIAESGNTDLHGAQSLKNVNPGDSLFSPMIDFMGLGGLSLVVVPLLLLLPDSLRPALAVMALYVSGFINHPHFIHSYQIFYRGFVRKISDLKIDRTFRIRYAFAGVIAPLLIATFLLAGVLRNDLTMLGFAASTMAFLVGWHYVKQGYGMMMVQSVLKKQFLNDGEKRALLYNAYACWAFSWLLLNYILKSRDMAGIDYLVVSIDIAWVYLSGVVALATSVWMATTLLRKAWSQEQAKPIAGIFAYVVSIYVWLFAALDPLVILIVPALHSLQYLTVVYRFELNYQHGQQKGVTAEKSRFSNSVKKRFTIFVLLGVIVGYFAFWRMPDFLEAMIPFDRALLGGSVFIFMSWLFINVHHYLIDNVIWRRENPETGKYLFAPR